MKTIVLVDAYSQIYRMFYAMRMLNNPAGLPVNALFGMVRLFLQLDKSLPSEYGAVVFDKGKAAKRLEICPEYKAQRPPMPEELRPQIPMIMEWLEAFGWNTVLQEGLEADDIIAAITRRRGDAQVRIVTADKDIAQLTTDPAVMVLTPEKGDSWSETGPAQVAEKFGVPPELLGDYLALVGDNSDNIRGVQGVGPKTAAALLNEYGSLDDILAEPSRISNAKLAAKLHAARELLLRNVKLVALDDQLPDNWTGLDSIARRTPDWDKIIEMAEVQGFRSIIPALKKRRDDSRQTSFF